MTERRTIYKCPVCEYCSERSYHYRRHMAAKHPEWIDPNAATEPAEPARTDGATCLVCGRTFSAKWYAHKHAATCDGVADPLECPRCHRRFASAVTKCRHLKGCAEAS